MSIPETHGEGVGVRINFSVFRESLALKSSDLDSRADLKIFLQNNCPFILKVLPSRLWLFKAVRKH